ncbi:MAG: diguanylate cyclase [Magnetococcales bacterium]|nr:diguanylate cyclase [Magnetococcales bacterium]
MLKYRFLRNSFIASILIAIILPIYSLFVTIPGFTAILTSNTEEDAVRVASHLVGNMRENSVIATNKQSISENFKKEVRILSKDFNVFKYRLFSPGGEIIFSSVESEIGNQNDKHYFHNLVAKGEVFTKTVSKESKSMDGENLKIDVVETYVPIMNGEQFLGAFEIYFDITSRKNMLDKAILRSTIMLIGIGVTLLLLVFFVRKSIIQPISQVSNAMKNLASGNQDQHVPVTGHDELSDMARIFNQMCNDLRITHKGLQSEKNKLTTILQGAREGIVATNEKGEVVLVNPAAQRLLGKSDEKIIKDGFYSLFDDEEFLSTFIKKSGVDVPEILVYNNHVLSIYASIINDNEQNVIGSATLIRDVTAEKELEDKLRNLSHTDGLTNLYNRRRMDELLQEEFARAKRYNLEFGFLFFDVDHFKSFNDKYGHDQGDRVLQGIAKVMKDHFRNVDFCCRYGGEEFCVIMPNTIAPGIGDAADRFRQKIEDMRIDDLHVTVSIGIVIYPHSGKLEDTDSVIQAADTAMYQAKSGGRNQICIAKLND